MIGNIIKILLALGGITLMVLNVIWGNYGYAISLLFPTFLVGLSLFRNERILYAMYLMRKQNMDKAEQVLSKIKNPENAFILKSQKAYYYYVLGLVSMHSKGVGKAETYIKKALNIGLRNDLDKAISKLQLAGAAASRRNISLANVLINEAKKLDKKGALDEQIKTFKKQLKAPQVMKRYR